MYGIVYMTNIDVKEHLLEREITLTKEDNFTVVMETLERIGMVSYHNKSLFQSCHILHKKDKFYIVHFKEMYALDGKPSTLTLKDIGVRNLIASLLEKWGLIKLITPITDKDTIAPSNAIFIIPHKERQQWKLYKKYLFKSLRK